METTMQLVGRLADDAQDIMRTEQVDMTCATERAIRDAGIKRGAAFRLSYGRVVAEIVRRRREQGNGLPGPREFAAMSPLQREAFRRGVQRVLCALDGEPITEVSAE
ncbi:MAG: hypothetical protein A3C90_03685 [Candidatus Magasanikbacteria bacterium RIFCSPHIGHO2_02_FULL_51_14]|uniref:Uncharacterized protein n=1 Tax=Candidatus Magasanikbacteria bacterium RIFCSPHIGHO2_02_FULL_51_14 TaxID=1798683 RepID=A0A1F6MPK8_9BACT|nr:MAG: hypothetical protein A3C90_03685 [Candidatus Magasanikbacteria bacterium RIFCSPHIGHO2_02_FULL_51_14]